MCLMGFTKQIRAMATAAGCCGDYEGRPHELDVGRSEVFEVSRDIGGYYGAQAEAEKDYAVIEGDIFGPEVVGGYGGVVA